jgi:AcrR family transcriptional regulator
MTTAVCEAILTRDFTPEGSAALTGEEVASYLAVLVRLAALDGIQGGEPDYVYRAAACLGVQAALADIAGQFVADPALTSESLIARIRDPGLRICLLRDAFRLAAIDGRFSEEEVGELTRIASALGIEPGVADGVRAIALEETRLHREFALLVRGARG